MLNGTFVEEQAAALAERLRRECGSSIESQIERAFELALARPPMPDELADVSGFIERQRQGFALVFNLNEFVYID
jgi:hypothetical protein